MNQIYKNMWITMFFMIFLVLFIAENISASWFWIESLNTGLVAYYDFEEESGDLIDRFRGIHNGTAVGDLTYSQTGIIGNGTEFGGSGDYFSVADSSDLDGSADFGYSLWINLTHSGKTSGILSYEDKEPEKNQTFHWVETGRGNDSYYMRLQESDRSMVGEVEFGTAHYNDWHHFVWTTNSSSVVLYVDGEVYYFEPWDGTRITTEKDFWIGGNHESTNSIHGTMDEFGIWNRSLTSSEIETLYNSGDGITYIPTSPIVTLNSPSDSSSFVTTTQTFNATISTLVTEEETYELKNATLYIWNSTDDLWSSTTNTLTGDGPESTTWDITGITLDTYEWNVYSCVGNETETGCNWGIKNLTFTRRALSEVSTTYETQVYETDYEKFELNISTIPSILSVSAKLNYNGIEYPSTVSCSSGNCSLTNNLDIPLISSGLESNRTFFWNISVYDGSSSSHTSSQTNYQNTRRIYLIECNTTYNTKALNFTAYDERNLTKISNVDFFGTLMFWIGQGSTNRNISVDVSNQLELTMCLSPINRTMYIDGQIDYGSEYGDNTYIDRDYFFENASINNITQNVSLYLLDAEYSTTFIQEVENQQSESIIGAYIYTQRYYPEDGIYRTVQISKTDDNGKSTGFYEVETVDYKHLIIDNGVTELETTTGKIVGESVPYTLIFRIGEALSYPWTELEEDSSITTSLYFNKTTNITTFSWIDTSGVVSQGRLLVYQIKADENNLLICNSSASFSSATLTCNVTGYSGNFEAYGYIASSPETMKKIINFVISAAREIFGNTGLILGWFIILTASLIFIWNPTAMVISHNIAVIFVNMIGLIDFGFTYIFTMIAVSLIIIIFMRS